MSSSIYTFISLYGPLTDVYELIVMKPKSTENLKLKTNSFFFSLYKLSNKIDGHMGKTTHLSET